MTSGLHHVLLLCVLVPDAQQHLVSSCTGQSKQPWNKEDMGRQLDDWMNSFHPVSVNEGRGSVREQYFEGFSGEHVSRETNTSRRTVGKMSGSVLQGLAWQWRGDHSVDGFLYGRLDRRGRFTGRNITFLYPDLVTGIVHIFSKESTLLI